MSDEPADRRAVVDRIVDGVAVLLVGPDEHEHELPAADLPAGAGEGAWLLVTGAGAGLRVVGVDEPGETEHRARTEQRMARLRRDRGGGRFPLHPPG